MHYTFLFCAILGGCVVVLQFFSSLLGVGGNDLDSGGDGGDVAGDADAADVGGADSGDSPDSADAGSGADATRAGFEFLKAFSFRSLTAGVAFFGLGGLIGESAGFPVAGSIALGVAAGFLAIWAVYKLMKTLTSLDGDGSIRTDSAVGCSGTVYLRIPAARAGFGKATILQQERSMEYEAATDGEELPTGTPIVVVAILGASRLLVARQTPNE